MGNAKQNSAVHFEVFGGDANALHTFYSWAIRRSLRPADGPLECSVVHIGDAGGIERLGGNTVQPPTQVPDGVTFALFTDPTATWLAWSRS